jgi:hypothetical protein
LGTIFIVVLIVGIIVQIVRTVINSKHKKQAKYAFDNLMDFKADNYYLSLSSDISIGFDTRRKKIGIFDKMHKQFFFDYNRILQCEIIIDGETVIKQSKTKTIGGNMLNGIPGVEVERIIKGKTGLITQQEKIHSIDLKIVLNDKVNPVLQISFFKVNPLFKIRFLKIQTKKASGNYKIACTNVQKWFGIISELIIQESNVEK